MTEREVLKKIRETLCSPIDNIAKVYEAIDIIDNRLEQIEDSYESIAISLSECV